MVTFINMLISFFVGALCALVTAFIVKRFAQKRKERREAREKRRGPHFSKNVSIAGWFEPAPVKQ